MRKPFAICINLGIAGFSALFSLICAEIVLALLAPSLGLERDILGRVTKTVSSLRFEKFEHDGLIYRDFEPEQTGEVSLFESYRFLAHIDRFRLRESAGPDLSPDALRILVLGDSQTFGWGVADSETFSARLERILKDGAHPRPVKVMNSGVPGYATHHQLRKLERIGPLVRPDLVIVVVFANDTLVPDPGNDLWYNFTYREGTFGQSAPTKTARIPFLTNHSHLYNRISLFRRRLRGVKSYEELLDEYRAPAERAPDLDLAWETTRELLKGIAGRAMEISGAPTVIAYLPDLHTLRYGDRRPLDELRKATLPLVTPFDELLAEMAKGEEKLLVKNDGHWNARAHEVIAVSLAAQLQNVGVLTPLSEASDR